MFFSSSVFAHPFLPTPVSSFLDSPLKINYFIQVAQWDKDNPSVFFLFSDLDSPIAMPKGFPSSPAFGALP